MSKADEVDENSYPSSNWKVVHIQGDGRCLFRSIVTALTTSLQTAKRDSLGHVEDEELSEFEKDLADKLRAKVIEYIETHPNDFESFDKAILNADQVLLKLLHCLYGNYKFLNKSKDKFLLMIITLFLSQTKFTSQWLIDSRT